MNQNEIFKGDAKNIMFWSRAWFDQQRTQNKLGKYKSILVLQRKVVSEKH